MSFRPVEEVKFRQLIGKVMNEANEDVESLSEDGDNLKNRVSRIKNGFRVTTRKSRNSEKSHNGGDYTYWTNIIVKNKRHVVFSYGWSADPDFDSFLPTPDYVEVPIDIRVSHIESMIDSRIFWLSGEDFTPEQE